MTPSSSSPPFDVNELLKTMREMGQPMMAKLEKIEDKMSNQATKDDLTQLRTEVFEKFDRVEKNMQAGYVQRDYYETRHGQLQANDARIEQQVRETNDRYIQWQNMQEGRLQSAKHEVDDRFAAVDKKIDEEVEDIETKALSTKDRSWIRWTQVGAIVSVIFTILSLAITFLGILLPHLQYHP